VSHSCCRPRNKIKDESENKDRERGLTQHLKDGGFPLLLMPTRFTSITNDHPTTHNCYRKAVVGCMLKMILIWQDIVILQ
jgi:hypothetical protein